MKNMKTKNLLLLISVAVLLLGAVGATVAYLTTQTTPIENTFTPSEVGVSVTDRVNGLTKSNVVITNDSDFPVYMRAAIVANWCKDDENGKPYVVAPWNDYGKIDPSAGWSREEDGYYYYSGKVPAGEGKPLFASYTASNPPEGAYLKMDIIAQVIQAEPTDAVEEAWDFIPN